LTNFAWLQVKRRGECNGDLRFFPAAPRLCRELADEQPNAIGTDLLLLLDAIDNLAAEPSRIFTGGQSRGPPLPRIVRPV
jgi:hypothetical protein